MQYLPQEVNQLFNQAVHIIWASANISREVNNDALADEPGLFILRGAHEIGHILIS